MCCGEFADLKCKNPNVLINFNFAIAFKCQWFTVQLLETEKRVNQLECYLRTKDFSQINQKKLENMNNIS